MCLKFMGADGSGFQSDAIQAIGYAALMKANIQNHSWGGKGVAKGLVRAVGIAGGLGHLFVTAAGNDGENLDYAQNMMPAGLSR